MERAQKALLSLKQEAHYFSFRTTFSSCLAAELLLSFYTYTHTHTYTYTDTAFPKNETNRTEKNKSNAMKKLKRVMAKYTAVHPMVFGEGRSCLDIARYIQNGKRRKVG